MERRMTFWRKQLTAGRRRENLPAPQSSVKRRRARRKRHAARARRVYEPLRSRIAASCVPSSSRPLAERMSRPAKARSPRQTTRLEGYVYRRPLSAQRAASRRSASASRRGSRRSTSLDCSCSARRCCRRSGGSASTTRRGRDRRDRWRSPAARARWWRVATDRRPARSLPARAARAEHGVRRRRARGPLARVPRQPRVPQQRARAPRRRPRRPSFVAPDLPRLRHAALSRQRRAAARRRAAAAVLPSARLLRHGGGHERRARTPTAASRVHVPHHRRASRCSWTRCASPGSTR